MLWILNVYNLCHKFQFSVVYVRNYTLELVWSNKNTVYKVMSIGDKRKEEELGTFVLTKCKKLLIMLPWLGLSCVWIITRSFKQGKQNFVQGSRN